RIITQPQPCRKILQATILQPAQTAAASANPERPFLVQAQCPNLVAEKTVGRRKSGDTVPPQSCKSTRYRPDPQRAVFFLFESNQGPARHAIGDRFKAAVSNPQQFSP